MVFPDKGSLSGWGLQAYQLLTANNWLLTLFMQNNLEPCRIIHCRHVYGNEYCYIIFESKAMWHSEKCTSLYSPVVLYHSNNSFNFNRDQ